MKVHIYPPERIKTTARFIMPLMLAAVVLCFFIYGFRNTSDSAGQEQTVMSERAIRNALISCYAIEGSYPQSISHLEDNYGLVINYKKYAVFYDILGSNIFPEVRLVPLDQVQKNQID